MDLLDARKKDGPMGEQQRGVYALRSELSDEKPRSTIHQGESRKSQCLFAMSICLTPWFNPFNTEAGIGMPTEIAETISRGEESTAGLSTCSRTQ